MLDILTATFNKSGRGHLISCESVGKRLHAAIDDVDVDVVHIRICPTTKLPTAYEEWRLSDQGRNLS